MRTRRNLPSLACWPGAFTSRLVCSGITRRCCDALPMSSATSQPRVCMKVMLSWLLIVFERSPGRDARPKSHEKAGVHTINRVVSRLFLPTLYKRVAVSCDPRFKLGPLCLVHTSSQPRAKPNNLLVDSSFQTLALRGRGCVIFVQRLAQRSLSGWSPQCGLVKVCPRPKLLR
jgi:hypothetical protein